MAQSTIYFRVLGDAKPKGSMRGFPIKRKNGRVGVAMTDANPGTKPWMYEVREAARNAIGTPVEYFDQTRDAELHMKFFFKRPKKHFRTGNHKDTLRSDAPYRYCKKPDDDKLVRAVYDALTGVIVKDDSQFWRHSAESVYVMPGELPGVHVEVVLIDDE